MSPCQRKQPNFDYATLFFECERTREFKRWVDDKSLNEYFHRRNECGNCRVSETASVLVWSSDLKFVKLFSIITEKNGLLRDLRGVIAWCICFLASCMRKVMLFKTLWHNVP